MTEQDPYRAVAEAPPEIGTQMESQSLPTGLVLIAILTQLAYRKWIIARVTGLGILSGALLCLVLPAKYTAATKIMPPQQTQSTSELLMSQLANSGARSLAAMAGGELRNPDDIYIGLLQSRPVADAIIREFGLASVYRAKDESSARRQLAKSTIVASEKSGFIDVSVTDQDRYRAAKIANAYTDQLRALTKTLAVTEAGQRRLFYEEALKQARENLVDAEYSFQQVQQRKGLVQPDAQARALIGSLAALHAEVAAKQVELQALRSYSTEKNRARRWRKISSRRYKRRCHDLSCAVLLPVPQVWV